MRYHSRMPNDNHYLYVKKPDGTWSTVCAIRDPNNKDMFYDPASDVVMVENMNVPREFTGSMIAKVEH